MNEKETATVKEVLKEMNNSHGIIALWLKGSPIETTLKNWIDKLEGLIK